MLLQACHYTAIMYLSETKMDFQTKQKFAVWAGLPAEMKHQDECFDPPPFLQIQSREVGESKHLH